MTRGARAAAIIITLVALGAAACARTPDRHSSRTTLASFTENQVAVEITLDVDSAGGRALRAAFTPTRPDLHLYAIELPKEGLRGIGRPTLLEIVPPAAVQATGPLRADRAALDMPVPTLGLTFPVYPAGPVELRLPVAVTPGPAAATLAVTYMACTDRACFAPVIDKRVAVTLPAS